MTPRVARIGLSDRTETCSIAGLFCGEIIAVSANHNQRITFNGSVTIPVTIAGLNGYQGVKAFYSTRNGLDLTAIPQLFLPPQAALQPDIKDNRWFLDCEFEQYLYQTPADPN